MRKLLIALFLASLSACGLVIQTAHAQAVQVCPADGSVADCRSYDTIKDAVKGAATESIINIPEGVYPESGILIENKDLIIRGQGARLTVVQPSQTPCAGDAPDRIFRIASARVRIEDLSIANGCVRYTESTTPEQPAVGAGIWNAGSLTLRRVIVRGNTITYNDIPAASQLWIPKGAGIYSVGSLEIVDSAIISNVASSPGVVSLGGGVYNNGRGYIVNTTISGNEARGIDGINEAFQGGGIYNAGTLIMEYTTVVLNGAPTAGGGLYSTGEVDLANNLFVANSSFGGDAACIDPVDQAGIEGVLAPSTSTCDPPVMGAVFLGDLSSDTPVPLYRPSPDSGSIDRGVCALSKVKVDQLGNRRGQGRECDLGATEAGASFLPAAFTALPQPDLIVSAVTVEPAGELNAGMQATIKVSIQNVGSKATAGRFYVDLFINPRQAPPNFAGYTWADLCRTTSCWDDEGIVWLAPPTIYPGESFTFSSNIDVDPYAVRQSSKWDKYFPAGEIRLWAFVDSYEVNRSPQGNVVEINEGNNRYEAQAFTVLPGRIPPYAASSAAQPNSAEVFAPRPQP